MITKAIVANAIQGKTFGDTIVGCSTRGLGIIHGTREDNSTSSLFHWPFFDDIMEDATETPAAKRNGANARGTHFQGLPDDVPEPTTRIPRTHLDADVVRHPKDTNPAS